MRTAPPRRVRRLTAVVLAAVLLLPLAFSGHDHGGEGSSRSCATCVAVRHTPSLGPVVALAHAPDVVAVVFQPAVTTASSATALPRRAGRAPPVAALVALV